MKLGFVSAILPEVPLADVIAFAREAGSRDFLKQHGHLIQR